MPEALENSHFQMSQTLSMDINTGSGARRRKPIGGGLSEAA